MRPNTFSAHQNICGSCQNRLRKKQNEERLNQALVILGSISLPVDKNYIEIPIVKKDVALPIENYKENPQEVLYQEQYSAEDNATDA